MPIQPRKLKSAIASTVTLASNLFMANSAFADSNADIAGEFAKSFSQGHFDAAEKFLDKSIAAALPAAKLAAIWQSQLDKNGKFKTLSTDRKTETKANLTAIYIPIEFEHGIIDLKIVVNAGQHISGLWLEPHGSATQATKAQSFVSLLSTGKFSEARKLFDAKMSSGIDEAKLVELWKSIENNNGKFLNLQAPELMARDSGTSVYVIPAKFEKSEIEFRVTTNSEGKVAGFFVGTRAKYTSPAYVSQAKFSEQKCQITSERPPLDALWTIPKGKGPFPALVLVHGSGPNDEDETVGAIKPFKDIAEGLASQGIAVLRYEKRTKQYPGFISADKITVQEETVDDAIAALKVAKSNHEIAPSRVFLLGHSLGGRLATRIAVQYPDIAGLIILAGDTRPYADLINDQIEYLFEGKKDSEQYKSLKDKIAQLKDPSLSENTPTSKLPFGLSAKYVLDLQKDDPVALGKKLHKPMLILQGERDYQVTAASDFRRWKDAFASDKLCRLKLYPDLNHLFVSGQGKSKPEEYDNAGNVSKQVVDDIAQWILQDTTKDR